MSLRSGGNVSDAQVLQPLTRNTTSDTKANTHTYNSSSSSPSALPQLPSAAQLSTASDTQVLPLLFDAYKLLRMTAPPYHVETDLLNELLTPRLLKHASPEVSQLVGCVLCDLIRLHSSSSTLLTNTTTATTTRNDEEITPLPFAAAYCADILHCIVRPFQALLEARTRSTTSVENATASASWTLQRCGYIIERLSASHALPRILPHCQHRVECVDLLQTFFDVVPCAQQQQDQTKLPTSRSTPASSLLTTSSVTCAEMARVLLDILELYNCITPAQLQPLMQCLVQASRALHAVQLQHKNTTTTITADREDEDETAMTLQTSSSSSSAAATIAARVLVEACDMVQPCLVTALMPEFERGVEELCAAETNAVPVDTNTTIGGGNAEDRLESRRRGLRAMAHTMEALVALVEVHVPFVEQLMPKLQLYLQHDHGDVRLLTLRGFYSAFMANEAVVLRYRAVFETLLVRAASADARPTHRSEMLQGVVRLVRQSTRQGWRPTTQALVWSIVQLVLEQRLVDVHASVRQQAVQSYCDALLLLFSHPTNTTTSNKDATRGGLERMSEATRAELLPSRETLSRTLGLRTADKHIRVREAAVNGLAVLYRRLLWSWIPNAIFAVAWAENGPRLLERTLERMLPSPNPSGIQTNTIDKGHNNTSSSLISPRTTTTTTRTGNTRNSGGEATLAVFEFEKEALRSGRSYVDALVQLCTDLDESMRPQLLSLMRRKVQLRKTIATLFTLRNTSTATVSRTREEQAAVVDKAHRLLAALRTITHAERGEWDTLYRAKDESVSRALLQACDGRNVNWHEARTTLLRILHGRLDASCDTFLRESLSWQLCFPLQRAHLEQLVELLLQVVPDLHSADNTRTTNDTEKNEKGVKSTRKRGARNTSKRHESDTTVTGEGVTEKQNTTTALGDQTRSRGIESETMRRYITGLFTTLQVFLTASPSYLPLCVPALLTLLSRLATIQQQQQKSLATCVPFVWWRIVLQCLQDWSDYIVTQQQQQTQVQADSGILGGMASHKMAGLKSVSSNSPEQTSPPLTDALKQSTMWLLRDLCLGTHTSEQRGEQEREGRDMNNNNANGEASILQLMSGQLAKHAARCFLALLAVPQFCDPAVLTALVKTLQDQLHAHIRSLCAQSDTVTTSAATRRNTRRRNTRSAQQQQQQEQQHTLSDTALLATLSALRSFAKHSLSAPLLYSEIHTTHNDTNAEEEEREKKRGNTEGNSTLQDTMTLMDILLRSPVIAACDKLKLQRNGTIATNTTTTTTAATNVDATTNTTPADTASATSSGATLPCSMQSALIDASAKAMSALALGITTNSNTADDGKVRRAQAVSCVLDCLLQGYKTVCRTQSNQPTMISAGSALLPVNSVGACQRRLALSKQMTKLLIQPSADIGKELAVAVVLSAESERLARRPLQRKLAAYLMQEDLSALCGVAGRCDMRYAALLFLTAMSEDSRSSFQELRLLVQHVGDCLQARRLAGNTTLNAPQAMYCYLEYTVPFLILFMAHHPLYASEKSENHFIAFQRVWHLLFDELLRHNTQCVGVLNEMLARIKQSDDLLDRTSNASRVLCDLASRVLWQCLGQRQIGADVLRRYNGPLLMPSFFVKSSTNEVDLRLLLETSYLDPNIRIATSAPFRIPAGPANATGAAESVTATTSVSRGAHGASVESNNDNEEEDSNGADDEVNRHGKRTRAKPTRALTPPSPHVHGMMAANNNYTPSPSVTPQANRQSRTAYGTSTNAPSSSILHRVEEVVKEMTQGCNKAAIAEMRWKNIRARMVAELESVPAERRTKEGVTLETMLERAKLALRAQYERASE